MAFRSSAYSVVARIFKLVDSNGFTRLFFGPVTVLTRTYYALRYEEPTWTNAQTETGLRFGNDGPPDQANATLYANGANDTTTTATVTASSTDIPSTPTKSTGASMQAAEDSGGVQREAAVNIGATSDPVGSRGTNILINSTYSGVGSGFAQIRVEAIPATGVTEIILVADRLGPWTAVPASAANWGNFGGAFQTVQYRKVGDMVQLRGEAGSTGANAANSVVTTLPVGFRPPATLQWIAELGANMGFIQINNAGQVICTLATPGAGFSLSINLTFYTST